jgi:hypothetical protein
LLIITLSQTFSGPVWANSFQLIHVVLSHQAWIIFFFVKQNLLIWFWQQQLPNFSYYISDFTYFCSQHLVTDIYASLVKYWILCFFQSAFQIWRKIT